MLIHQQLTALNKEYDIMKTKVLITLFTLELIINSLFALSHDDLCIMLALNNPTLINLNKDIELAKLDIKDAKAQYHPKIDFLISATYMINPPIGKIVVNPDDYISGESGTSGTLTPLSTLGLEGPLTVYKGMERTQYNFKLSLVQPLFTWNKIKKSVDIYKKIHILKQLDADINNKKFVNELEAREASLYYLSKIKSNLNEQQDISKKLIQIAEESLSNDLILEIDLLEIKIKAKEIDIALSQINSEINNQLSFIHKLCNNSSIKLKDIEYVFDEIKISNIIEKGIDNIKSKALKSENSNIQSLLILESIKADEINLSKKDIYWKPDFALQIEASYNGPRFPIIEKGYFTQNQSGFNFSLVIKSTLWDGGVKLNDIVRKEIEATKVKNNSSETKNQIKQLLQENYNNLTFSEIKINYLFLKQEVLDKKIEKQEIEYNQGYGKITDIFNSKLEKLNILLEINHLKLEQCTNYFSIAFFL